MSTRLRIASEHGDAAERADRMDDVVDLLRRIEACLQRMTPSGEHSSVGKPGRKRKTRPLRIPPDDNVQPDEVARQRARVALRRYGLY